MRETDRVRIILVSPGARVLMFKYRNIGPTGVSSPCWTLVGGGREDGETLEQTALREVVEETGVTDVRLGPVVWYGEDSHRSGGWNVRHREHFILAFAGSEAIQESGWTEHEQAEILETRWWRLEDLRHTDEPIYPFGLAGLLEPLLRGEHPKQVVTLPPI